MAKQQAGQGGSQMGLPTLDWSVCQCGCGYQFLNKPKGRKRRYYNDSHKKRAYRYRMLTTYQNDVISYEMWKGDTDRHVEAWARYEAETDKVLWARYELERRARVAAQ